MSSYTDFIVRKTQWQSAGGFQCGQLPSFLYDFQAHLVEWALSLGRAAIFADCGMGKTAMQLAWASQVAEREKGLTSMGRHKNSPMAHVDRRAKNNQRITDVCEIRDDAMRLGLQETTERWKPRYDVEWIEDVVFYRIHKSILEGSCQYEVDGD